MQRKLFVLGGALILASLGFACAPLGTSEPLIAAGAAPPPPAPRTALAPRLPATCSADNSTFLSHVKLLRSGYPGPNAHPYAPPAGVSPDYVWQSPLSDDLEAAYSSAPQFFKDYLCGLQGIYVNANACTNNDPTRCTLTGANDVLGGAFGY